MFKYLMGPVLRWFEELPDGRVAEVCHMSLSGRDAWRMKAASRMRLQEWQVEGLVEDGVVERIG